ncbi:hypothetical protein LTR53_015286 [Teratosphaeriaceae sp. CCFEE 6253]|nr:hypothetical protein LTR53_015286 [Teratosphaeriaceae sp. CCFEE 6253]
MPIRSASDDLQFAESLLLQEREMKSDSRENIAACLTLSRPQAQRPDDCTCPRRDTDLSLRVRGFKPGKHSAYALASRAVASFASEGGQHGRFRWGPMRALEKWNKWWDHGRSTAAKALRSLELRQSIPEPDAFFKEPVQIFNQLFFLGSLPPRHIQVVWGLDTSNLYGLAVARSTIILNPQKTQHKLAPARVLCTILHEMIHCFLGLYSCHGDAAGCGDEVCASAFAESWGLGGHGRAWQYVAKHIEAELPRILGITGRLGRQENAVREIKAFGFRPSPCDMRGLYEDMEVSVRVYLRTSFDDLDLAGRGVVRSRAGVARKVRRRRTIAICEGIAVV